MTQQSFPPANATADLPAKASFALHWSAWLIYVAAAIGVVALYALTWKGDPRFLVALCMALVLVQFVVALFPAMLAFFLAGRSRVVASVFFAIFLLIGVLAQALANKKIIEYQEDQFSAVSFRVPLSPADTEPAQESPVSDIPVTMLDEPDRSVPQAPAAAVPARASRETVIAAYKEVHQALETARNDYKNSAKNLAEFNPAYPDWVQRRSDFATARAAIDEFEKQSRNLRAVFDNSHQLASAALDRQRVDAATKTEILGYVDQIVTKERNAIGQVRDDDERFVKILRSVADLLEKNWGQWQFDRDTRHLNFKSEAVYKRFSSLSDDLDTVIAHQMKLNQYFTKGRRAK